MLVMLVHRGDFSRCICSRYAVLNDASHILLAQRNRWTNFGLFPGMMGVGGAGVSVGMVVVAQCALQGVNRFCCMQP